MKLGRPHKPYPTHNGEDMTGKFFGKWKVLSRAPNKKNYLTLKWRCLCTGCNKEFEVYKSNLTSGRSTQCPKCELKYTKKRGKDIRAINILYHQDFNTGVKSIIKIFISLTAAKLYRDYMYGEAAYKENFKLSEVYPIERMYPMKTKEVFKLIES